MLQRLRLLRAAIRLVRDPKNLDEVFGLADSLARTHDLSDAIDALKTASPAAEQAFGRRLRVKPVRLETLAAFPAGSLGRAFAVHCIDNDLDPDVFFGRAAGSDADYMLTHLYETHDIWHAVTGFETDVAGELGLQAFYLAQFRGLLALLLIPMGMLNTFLFEQDDYSRRMDAISAGWRAGKRAAPLFGVDWSSMWHRPLAEIRAELDLVPIECELESATPAQRRFELPSRKARPVTSAS